MNYNMFYPCRSGYLFKFLFDQINDSNKIRTENKINNNNSLIVYWPSILQCHIVKCKLFRSEKFRKKTIQK